jgi:hypothetical protein
MKFTKDLSKLDDWVLKTIERAKEVGLKFDGYGVIDNDEDCQSYHVFVWDWSYESDGETVDFKREGPEWDRVKEFLHRDDDSQPCGTYITYFGSQIWNFIVGLG